MPPPLTPEAFQVATGVSRETLQRLRDYVALLEKWSARLNLIGAATRADVWRRHLLDSAQLAPLVPPGARRGLDIGSGAGFPGLVLAILGAVAEMYLVEADQRKAVFLREAARCTGVAVQVHTQRIEALSPFAVDVITARAVAPLPTLLAWAFPFVTAGATRCLFLKGARVALELTAAAQLWHFDVVSTPDRSGGGGVALRIESLTKRAFPVKAPRS